MTSGAADPATGRTPDHLLRGLLTVVVGEVELVLADPACEGRAREESAGRVLAVLRDVEVLLDTHRLVPAGHPEVQP